MLTAQSQRFSFTKENLIYNADETEILIFDVNKVHIVQSITGSFLQDVIVSSRVVFKNSGRGCMLVKQREAFPLYRWGRLATLGQSDYHLNISI